MQTARVAKTPAIFTYTTHLILKMNLKYITDLSTKHKTIKFLEKNTKNVIGI